MKEHINSIVGKKDFIHHTSRYIKQAEEDGEVIITHHNKPTLKLIRIRSKLVKDLKGKITRLKIKGTINDHVLKRYDEW